MDEKTEEVIKGVLGIVFGIGIIIGMKEYLIGSGLIAVGGTILALNKEVRDILLLFLESVFDKSRSSNQNPGMTSSPDAIQEVAGGDIISEKSIKVDAKDGSKVTVNVGVSRQKVRREKTSPDKSIIKIKKEENKEIYSPLFNDTRRVLESLDNFPHKIQFVVWMDIKGDIEKEHRLNESYRREFIKIEKQCEEYNYLSNLAWVKIIEVCWKDITVRQLKDDGYRSNEQIASTLIDNLYSWVLLKKVKGNEAFLKQKYTFLNNNLSQKYEDFDNFFQIICQKSHEIPEVVDFVACTLKLQDSLNVILEKLRKDKFPSNSL